MIAGSDIEFRQSNDEIYAIMFKHMLTSPRNVHEIVIIVMRCIAEEVMCTNCD